MSDRILIMYEGSIAGDVPAEGADDELLLSYAYGRSTS
jgi:ABC-type sugar transport system ATPase subunit